LLPHGWSGWVTGGCPYHHEGDRPLLRRAADRLSRRLTTVALEMSAAEFETHVATALDTIPAELAALIDNCVVLVEDDPPDDVLPDTLGLYSGTPLTERGDSYTGLPDTVQIFRNPILAICDTEEEVIEEVRITVVHEIAHHFGISDDRLHELGYG
jgi:predicted Zn-dependent protease with MMP-like domain